MVRPRARFALALLLAALSGTLTFLAIATFDIWPLGWICLLPLLCAAEVLGPGASHGRVFLVGWFGGAIANAGGFYWMWSFLERFGHLPSLAALPLYLLLVAYQGLLFGGFLAIASFLISTGLSAVLAAPLALVPLELGFPLIFPWYLAVTQTPVPANIQIAEWTGPTGVSALLALTSGALFDLLLVKLWRRPCRRPATHLVTASILVTAALAWGAWRVRTIEARRAAAPSLAIGVVQGNIAQEEKFDPRYAAAQLEAHQQASRDLSKRGAELIVWPESSYPHMIHRDQWHDFPVNAPERIRKGWDVPTIIGAPTGKKSDDGKEVLAWNSAIFIDAGDRFSSRFDKNYLMVFGEYIPFYRFLPQFKEWFPEASNWERGNDITVFSFRRTRPRHEIFRIAPIICYEDILPAFVRRFRVHEPHLFVNLTNDAWFGKTSEPYEHLDLAIFRSVEHRRDLVRAVNTGVSAFISASGRVYRQSPVIDPATDPKAPLTLFDRAALLEGNTLYGEVGDLFAYLCTAALAVLLWRRSRPARCAVSTTHV